VQVECLAGVSTFLALSYIFIVNPAILSQAGMSKGHVLFARRAPNPYLIGSTICLVLSLLLRLG